MTIRDEGEAQGATGHEENPRDEQTQRILEYHHTIADTLLGLRDEVNRTVDQNPESAPDSAGWRMYFYGPEQLTQQQLEYRPTSVGEALNMQFPDPYWEIDYFPPGKSNARGESLPEGLAIHRVSAPDYSLNRPVFMELYPMASPTLGWTRITEDIPELSTRPSVTRDHSFPAVYSEVDHRQPEFADTRRRDDVVLFGVAARDTGTALEKAEDTYQQLSRFMGELQAGRFRVSIFGNTNQASPMKPIFISPRTQLPPAQ